MRRTQLGPDSDAAIPLAILNRSTNAVDLKAPYTPGTLITLETDGINLPSDEFTHQSEGYLDQGKSRVFGLRTMISYMHGENMAARSPGDDKAIVGYTSDGLPFQIIAHGLMNNDDKIRVCTFEFIDVKVRPLIENYSEKLSGCDSDITALVVIKELIKTIDELARRHIPAVDLSLSLGITYAYNNHFYIAGFGIGDCGLVMQSIITQNVTTQEGPKHEAKLTQLAHSTHLTHYNSKSYDTFGKNRSADIDLVIERNSIFNLPVTTGDEILGYTFLFPEFSEEAESTLVNGVRACASKLSPEKLNRLSKKVSLFNSVKEATCRTFEDVCTETENDQLSTTILRNCMLSGMTIPTPEIRQQLKERIFRKELAQLEAKIKTLQDPILEKATAVYNAAKALEKTEDLTELTRDLAACNSALQLPSASNINALYLRANKPHQFPSLGRMILSTTLIVVGLMLTVAGIILALGGAALLPSGILSAAGLGGIIGGAVTAAVGVSLVATGIGIYASGYRGGVYNNLKDQLIETHHPKLKP